MTEELELIFGTVPTVLPRVGGVPKYDKLFAALRELPSTCGVTGATQWISLRADQCGGTSMKGKAALLTGLARRAGMRCQAIGEGDCVFIRLKAPEESPQPRAPKKLVPTPKPALAIAPTPPQVAPGRDKYARGIGTMARLIAPEHRRRKAVAALEPVTVDPLTAIAAKIETMLDGLLSLKGDPEEWGQVDLGRDPTYYASFEREAVLAAEEKCKGYKLDCDRDGSVLYCRLLPRLLTQTGSS